MENPIKEMPLQLPPPRQCGKRKAGGVYLTVDSSPDGMPLEFFLLDPPAPLDMAAMGITPVGVHKVDRAGVIHVFDVVGEDNYPNTIDVIEEARRLGISRRAELFDYSDLTRNSRLILVHRRAMIENYPEMLREMTQNQLAKLTCPHKKHITPEFHKTHILPQMCGGLWWHDLEVESAKSEEESLAPPEKITRTLACGRKFEGWARPADFEPQYAYAAFASFPISRIEVVRENGEVPEKKKARLSKSQLEVKEVDE